MIILCTEWGISGKVCSCVSKWEIGYGTYEVARVSFPSLSVTSRGGVEGIFWYVGSGCMFLADVLIPNQL